MRYLRLRSGNAEVNCTPAWCLWPSGTTPIPSRTRTVKRSHGDDSWGVAPCQNSSLPSLIFIEEEEEEAVTHLVTAPSSFLDLLLAKQTLDIKGFLSDFFY